MLKLQIDLKAELEALHLIGGQLVQMLAARSGTLTSGQQPGLSPPQVGVSWGSLLKGSGSSTGTSV